MKLEYTTDENGSILIHRGSKECRSITGVIANIGKHYAALDCALRSATELRAIADKLDELNKEKA